VWPYYGRFRLEPTQANGQPAFVLYTQEDGERAWLAHSVQVLETEADAVVSLTTFLRPMAPMLVPAFRLPLVIEG
jgi:RNA polymerase sigma-70 factor (ECF subfamily)